ncbi:alpha/beta fold hydrolase [Neobacillus niacini]|uniref:alpha/beta fold hydrolase n=1 Tax=Neobacillus niacini TaxID=86668 RepID=UPI0021CB88B9|nr:alpha/beta hydrolase [Neobacillus niacini]MCM3764252.1 alpha/beta hydrolase [Neobacillus niacini]
MFKRSTPTINSEHAVAELQKVRIGGVDQWLLIRGESLANPILLMLHGGPGAAQIGFNREYQKELEKHFIVVNWDQRGSGLSFSKSITKESMSVNQFLNDAIEVTVYLKTRFQKEKIYLIGHSWGSILGMLTIHKYPGDFFHYFGVSQVASMRAAEELSYNLILEQAKKKNDQKAINDLTLIGKPPWRNLRHDKVHQKYVDLFGGGISHDGKLVNVFVKKLLKSKEYTFLDVVNHLRGQLFSMKSMLVELRDLDLKDVIHNVEVPVTIMMGRHDLTVPHAPTQEFFDQLQAPSKEWLTFENSAHSPNYEELEKFTQIVVSKLKK